MTSDKVAQLRQLGTVSLALSLGNGPWVLEGNLGGTVQHSGPTLSRGLQDSLHF